MLQTPQPKRKAPSSGGDEADTATEDGEVLGSQQAVTMRIPLSTSRGGRPECNIRARRSLWAVPAQANSGKRGKQAPLMHSCLDAPPHSTFIRVCGAPTVDKWEARKEGTGGGHGES